MKIRRILKQKLALRLMLAAVITGVAVLSAIVSLVIIHLGETGMTRASENGGEAGLSNVELNNGEILSRFDWDHDPASYASIGPNAIAIGKSVICAPGGRSSTNGLNPGTTGDGINM